MNARWPKQGWDDFVPYLLATFVVLTIIFCALRLWWEIYHAGL